VSAQVDAGPFPLVPGMTGGTREYRGPRNSACVRLLASRSTHEPTLSPRPIPWGLLSVRVPSGAISLPDCRVVGVSLQPRCAFD
jgi:hypothetical protein